MILTRTLVAAFLLALAARPALAELTAEQVLENQLSLHPTPGITVRAAGTRRSGSVLTVDRFLAEAPLPDGEGTLLIGAGGASFAERDDGTVLVTFPPESTLTVQALAAGGEALALEATIRQSGARTVVSGTPGRIRYESAIPSAVIDGFRMTAPGMPETLAIVASIEIAGYEGRSDVAGSEARGFRDEGTVDSIQVHAEIGERDGAGSIGLRFGVADVSIRSSGRAAPHGPDDSLVTPVPDGGTFEMAASAGPGRHSARVSRPDRDPVEISAGSASSDAFLRIGGGAIAYGGTARGGTLTALVPELLGVPANSRLQELSARFLLPARSGREPRRFASRIGISGLEIGQGIWSILDPGGVLDRAPATLVLDVEGEAVMPPDGPDGDLPGIPGMAQAPADIRSLDLNELRIKAAGAEVAGDGAFAFVARPEGPWPVGRADLTVTGDGTLLDGLAELGFVQDLQALAIRGMLQALARPADGPDDFGLTIRAREDGSVLVNGQRIR